MQHECESAHSLFNIHASIPQPQPPGAEWQASSSFIASILLPAPAHIASHGMATLPSAACCAAACAVADCSCVEDVGRRVWYCLQHQVACEQAVSAGSNYVSTAATQTVQQGAQCPSGVLQTATVAGGLAGAPAAQMVGADDSRAAGLHDLLCAWVLVSPKVCALAAELEDMPVVNGCQHSKRT